MDQTPLPTSPQVTKPRNPKGPCHLVYCIHPPTHTCTYTLTASTASLAAPSAEPIMVLQLDTQRPRDKHLGVPGSSLR